MCWQGIFLCNLTEGAAVEIPYSYKLICRDNRLVEKCTGIQLTNKRVADAEAADSTILEFVLVFTPPKAFKYATLICLVIKFQHVYKPTGVLVIYTSVVGKELHGYSPSICLLLLLLQMTLLLWKLHALTLKLKSAWGWPVWQSKIYQLLLHLIIPHTPWCRHPVPYTAYISGDSDIDITVMPTSGELTPVNSQGTPLYITYKPRACGRKHRAKLIVQVSMGFMHWKNYNAFYCTCRVNQMSGVMTLLVRCHLFLVPCSLINNFKDLQ